MNEPDPRRVQAMRDYLKERFGITSYRQLREKLWEAPLLDLTIFNHYGPDDDFGRRMEGNPDVRPLSL